MSLIANDLKICTVKDQLELRVLKFLHNTGEEPDFQ